MCEGLGTWAQLCPGPMHNGSGRLSPGEAQGMAKPVPSGNINSVYRKVHRVPPAPDVSSLKTASLQ